MENTTFSVTTDLLATRGQRFANYVVDSIVKYAVRVGLVALSIFMTDGYYSGNIFSFTATDSAWLNLLLGYGLSLVYYFIFEALTQRTVGKYVTNTIVITLDGTKPDLDTTLKRTLCRIIPFEAFSFFSADARGWHDTMTDTAVVDAKKYTEALNLKNSFSEIGAVQDI